MSYPYDGSILGNEMLVMTAKGKGPRGIPLYLEDDALKLAERMGGLPDPSEEFEEGYRDGFEEAVSQMESELNFLQPRTVKRPRRSKT